MKRKTNRLVLLSSAEFAQAMKDLRVNRGKPGRCPYCRSQNIDAHAGHWECRDCGQEGTS